MIRALPVAAVLLAIGLSGCGTVSDPSVAASVGDGEVSRDDFEEFLAGWTDPEFSAVTGMSVDEETGTVQGDVRSILSVFVQQEASRQFLAEHDEEITDADRATFTDQIPPEDQFWDLPEDAQRVVADQQGGLATALGRVEAPPSDELQESYEEDPSSIGVVCMRHILSDTEADAEEILAELEAGADFTELAIERSTDPTAVDNGGLIQSSTGQPCMAVAEATQGLDPTFVEAALQATPTQRVGPVETSFGYHVIEALPYEEAEESLALLFAQAPGQLLLDGFLASLDVDVDPRYGVWDDGSRTVVPLT